MKRKVHFATKLRNDGAASALCFDTPRAIDMKRATWTTSIAVVTCKECLRRHMEAK